MPIDLDNETQLLIDREIAAGHFRTAGAFVGAAVRHFLVSREDIAYTHEQIDAMIAQSIASLARGQGVDGEEFFSELEREERDLQLQRR